MTPENELGIGASFEVIQRYTCKNRVTKAKIKMVRIKYLVNGKDVGRGVYLTCLDHNETRHCQNKTEALYQMRQPWVWCDGCCEINDATDRTCPDCGGAGELAGDYFSSDGMFSCGRCQGRGTL